MTDTEYADMIEKGIDKQCEKYINDPNTKVFINHTNETGKWVYAVQVEDVDFWLSAFKHKKDVLKYIRKNKLLLVEEKNAGNE